MAGRLLLDLGNPALDSNGRVDVGEEGASMRTYYAANTTDLETIYATKELITPLDNPLFPDDAGRFPIVWAPDDKVYDVKWELVNGDIVTFDDIFPFVFDESGSLTSFYDLWINVQDEPGVSETWIFNCVRAVQLPEGLVGSVFTVAIAPTAETTVTLYKNVTVIGTLEFQTDSSVTITFAADVSFAPEDQFRGIWQASPDATAAGIALNFVFEVI